MEKHIRLYAHVEFVRGSQTGALYDLQGGQVRTVPLVLETIINAFHSAPSEEVLQKCFSGNNDLFKRYTDFLLEGNWAFITTRPERYPAASLSWESPYPINTGLLAHDLLRPYDLPGALQELSTTGCRHLELQLFNYPIKQADSAAWRKIANTLQKGEFRRGTLVLRMDQGAVQTVNPVDVEKYLEDWPRFGTVVILGQKKNQNLNIGKRKYYLRTAEQLVDYAKKTWELHPDTHFLGPAYFREARVANPYFNRRLAIDRSGNYKNDLLYGGQETFGRVGERSIKEVIADPAFRQRWLASPDTIAETAGNPLRYCLRYDRAITPDPKGSTAWSFSAA